MSPVISLADLPRTAASSEFAFSKSFIVFTALDSPLTSAPMDTRPAAMLLRDLVRLPVMERRPLILLGSCSICAAVPEKAFCSPSASFASSLKDFLSPWSL